MERKKQQGMTLIEIMIVVIIMAMIASGVAVAVIKYLDEAKIEQAKVDVSAVRTAAYWFYAHNSRTCPDFATLLEEGMLAKEARSKDPWENDFVITCSDGEIDVFSKGPDMQENTDDDIR